MQEPRTYHKCTWLICEMCKDEYLGKKSNLCPACKQARYLNTKAYQKWIAKQVEK